MIINKGVIGWFQDKMEFGPRALGNRSILADPRNKKIKDLINLKIKRRESFRPFAPSVLSDFQNDWFEEIYLNQYMSSVMKAKSDKKHLIPGVVHIDGSSRVQTVLKKNNKTFHNLIYNFFLKTGVPLLLNTSFNENEPIVRSPEEAIECLLRTNMDGLFINSFFIKKI
jgi:carbamoyltransferase